MGTNGATHILKSYINNDILSVIKSFLLKDEWNYLDNKWGLIHFANSFAIKYGYLDLWKYYIQMLPCYVDKYVKIYTKKRGSFKVKLDDITDIKQVQDLLA